MQNAHKIVDLLNTIQTAAQAATKELHALGAVGIWETIRRRAEKGALVEMLDITNGNQSESALKLGVNRNTLGKRAEYFGIDPLHPEYSRANAKLPKNIPWQETGADITITINGKAGKGSTTTGYWMAQTLKAAGFEVHLAEICNDCTHLRINNTTDVDSYAMPLDLQPRRIQIRVGGGE